ncbi:uncharacterized protein LOC129808560 [Phlebotomus papatasi]|uniref:uncharacterized protein LOC129808560 n=1 Tax=Phlebotomus papatasi TaxID=29031 RepID=UPI002483DC51|nr:uncharacterized protein LOC129808560 [Phlebotomus papatasi]
MSHEKIVQFCKGSGGVQLNKVFNPQSVVCFHQGLRPVDKEWVLWFEVFAGSQHIFRCLLDVIDVNGFELLHFTPVPHPTEEGTFVIPLINASNIGVDYNNQLYYFYDAEGSTCHRTGKGRFICSPHAVFSMRDHPNCVLEEIIHKHSMEPCRSTQVRIEGVLWKGLIRRNSWLYITQKSTTIAVICSGNREEFTPNVAGVIHVNDGCSISSSGMWLRATINSEMWSIEAFHKPIPLNERVAYAVPGHVRLIDNQPVLSSKPLLHENSEVIRTITIEDVVRHPATTWGSLIIVAILGIALWKTREIWLKICGKPSSEAEEQNSAIEKLDCIIKRKEEAAARNTPVPAPGQDG